MLIMKEYKRLHFQDLCVCVCEEDDILFPEYDAVDNGIKLRG